MLINSSNTLSSNIKYHSLDDEESVKASAVKPQSPSGQSQCSNQSPHQGYLTCTLIVDGMTCSACQQTIENHLNSLDGIKSATVSLLTHKANVDYQPKAIGIRTIIEEIECLGFDARFEAQSDKTDIRDILEQAVTKQKAKFQQSLYMFAPIFVLIWIIPFILPGLVTAINFLNGVPLYVYVTAGFSTIIQLIMGAPFYQSALNSVKHYSANMDVLVVLGTTAAWGYGLILILVGYTEKDRSSTNYMMQIQNHAHNFEISSALITIILIGKYIETLSKKKTVDQLAQLASLKVTRANLVESDSTPSNLNCPDKEIEVELVQINDYVKIYPGQGIPVDGIVIIGKGSCNEAMLTGESNPVQKQEGSKLFGGSVLNQGLLIMQVTRTSENSSLNQIIKLVENAQNARAPIQGLADRISQIFVPFVVILTFITWMYWFIKTYTETIESDYHGMSKFHFAFSFGISTLVIACPCALGLATPTAVMVGTGIAASYGILIKGGDVLEKISSITTIVFDKTGTLTSGTPHVKDIISVSERFQTQSTVYDRDTLLYFTYLAEKSSEHPLAKAIVNKLIEVIPSQTFITLQKRFQNKQFKNRDGEGLTAQILDTNNDQSIIEILCGNDKLYKSYSISFPENVRRVIDTLEEQGKTVVTMSVGGSPQIILSLEEMHIAKPESRQVVDYLRNTLKLRVAMITGDNKHSAYKVANYLGIDIRDVVYKAYPIDKRRAVERMQANNQKVMFVGDGINDSPVLAQADVGLAINPGSDITVNAAGIVLMKDSLCDVVNAINISKASFKRIKINFIWAFLYNLILIPIAMGALYPSYGFKLDPMLAGAAMALSSISVVLSSLILKLYKPFLSQPDVQKHSSSMHQNNHSLKTGQLTQRTNISQDIVQRLNSAGDSSKVFNLQSFDNNLSINSNANTPVDRNNFSFK